MKQYNIEAGTVTLSINDYCDLVADQGLLRTLYRNHLTQWDNYSAALIKYHTGFDLSFNELNGFALRLMRDMDADDYTLTVASEWLRHQLAFEGTKNFGEWVAISRDLEQQLKEIYRRNCA